MIRIVSTSTGRRLGLALFLVLGSGAVHAAQAAPPRVLVSTTSDVPALGLDDADLVAVGGQAAVEPWFVSANFLATAGIRPSDVDAFGWRPQTVPGSAASMAFSISSMANREAC